MDAAVHDVAIIGAGPAGLGLAAACADLGLRPVLVAPEPDARWWANYGGWYTDVEACGLSPVVRRRWEEVMVVIDDTRAVDVGRPYALLDRDALQDALAARAAGAGRVRGRAGGIVAEGDHMAVLDGAAHGAIVLARARVVVDASGHEPALAPPRPRVPGVQTALGWEVTCAPGSFRPGTCTLMDFRGDHLPPDDPFGAVPSFLYALPTDDRRALLEETVLVARPLVPLEVLEVRLRRRLARLGIEVEQVDAVERCFIPMGGGLPPGDRWVAAFGGAAGMVHPATGYQVLRALAAAPRVARAVAEARSLPPARRAAHVRRAVWPRDARARQALYDFGMEAMLGFSAAEVRAFFAHFFALDATAWASYLSDTGDAASVKRTMWALYRSCPPKLRRALRRAGWSGPGLRLLASAL